MSYSVNDVYTKALGFLGELDDPQGAFDYEARAPYLIASFCCNAKSLDKTLREANCLEEEPSFSPIYISISEDFPLCDELIHPATLYVASMLVIDENSELSEKLYDQYCDSMATLAASLNVNGSPSVNPAVCESISEKYFFD